MRSLVVVSFFAALSGCMNTEEVVELTAREQAKNVVNALVAQQFPSMNAAPVTDCIVDAASTQEIVTIGASALTGTTESTTDLVLSIAQRPEAIACIASNGTGLLTL